MPLRAFTRSFVRGGVLVTACLLVLIGIRPSASHAQAHRASHRANGHKHVTASEIRFTLRYAVKAERPANVDRWWARDKARHLVFSGLWTLSTQYVLVNKANWSESSALPASVGFAGAVGIAKELYDAQSNDGRFSTKDLAADAFGICLAAGVIVL